MTPELIIRILQVAAIIESWVAAVWLFRHHHPDPGQPISSYGGSDKASYLVFAFTLTIHPVIYVAFCTLWLIPTVQPSPVFVPVMLIAATCQLLSAWIPYGHKPILRLMHNTFAISMSATMPIMTAIILTTGTLSTPAAVVNWLALGIMLLIPLPLWIAWRKHAGYFWLQSAYILSFQLATVAIAVAG